MMKSHQIESMNGWLFLRWGDGRYVCTACCENALAKPVKASIVGAVIFQINLYSVSRIYLRTEKCQEFLSQQKLSHCTMSGVNGFAVGTLPQLNL